MISKHPLENRVLRTTFLLWTGNIGGAETFTVELASAMAQMGAEPSIVFIQGPSTLEERLATLSIPSISLGLPRGRSVLRAPLRLARAVNSLGADVAIAVEAGYIAGALRLGGFRGPIIGVEHGSLLRVRTLPAVKRAIRKADRRVGRVACTALVAVSEYMAREVQRVAGTTPVTCIPNGVDTMRFTPEYHRARPPALVIGCAARLVPGKGIEDAIRALAYWPVAHASLRIAGDGPLRGELERLATSLEVSDRVTFLGRVLDMPAFWRSVDIGIVPSNVAESFGITAVEAMASGKPVVATNTGELPIIVVDGECGRIVPAGNAHALAAALKAYVREPRRIDVEGRNARRRAEHRYSIRRTASAYLRLCAELARDADDIGSRGSERRLARFPISTDKHSNSHVI